AAGPAPRLARWPGARAAAEGNAVGAGDPGSNRLAAGAGAAEPAAARPGAADALSATSEEDAGLGAFAVPGVGLGLLLRLEAFLLLRGEAEEHEEQQARGHQHDGNEQQGKQEMGHGRLVEIGRVPASYGGENERHSS